MRLSPFLSICSILLLAHIITANEDHQGGETEGTCSEDERTADGKCPQSEGDTVVNGEEPKQEEVDPDPKGEEAYRQAQQIMRGWGGDFVPSLQIAASKRHVEAMNLLAVLYLRGDYIDKNGTRAEELLTMAAEAGHNTAKANLAWVLENGEGKGPKNVSAALFWYGKSAENGNVKVLSHIAELYVELGQYTEAAVAAQNAVDQGQNGGYVVLGNLHEHGYGVDQNYSQAHELYTQAKSSRGHHRLCHFHRQGLGVEKNEEKAHSYCLQAAQEGYPPAMVSAGIDMITGRGTSPDLSGGLSWLRHAAHENDAHGLLNLGVVFKHRLGKFENEDHVSRAITALTQAAEKGSRWAMLELADSHSTTSPDLAKEWSEKAQRALEQAKH